MMEIEWGRKKKRTEKKKRKKDGERERQRQREPQPPFGHPAGSPGHPCITTTDQVSYP